MYWLKWKPPYLNDYEQTDTRPNVSRISIHARHHVHDSLTHCHHHAKHCTHTHAQANYRMHMFTSPTCGLSHTTVRYEVTLTQIVRNSLKCPFYTALSSMVCTLQSHSWFHKNAPPTKKQQPHALLDLFLVTLLPVKTHKFLYRHDIFLVDTNTDITCMVSNGAE